MYVRYADLQGQRVSSKKQQGLRVENFMEGETRKAWNGLSWTLLARESFIEQSHKVSVEAEVGIT